MASFPSVSMASGTAPVTVPTTVGMSAYRGQYRRTKQVVSGDRVCVMSACVSTGGRSRWLVGIVCV